MLTGDENIVDVDFAVLWKVKPNGVGDYLFNIQNPEGTVKAVAESAMREVIGRSDIQPILTGARQTIEAAVQELMQKTLDHYGAGILIQQVQLQKVDPPTQVIDAFRDVQAARIDLDRSHNEAQTYANRVVPEARGNVAKITQAAEAYKSQTVAQATGETSRFLQIYEQYKKAPDVTRERMYLETMERVLGGTDKIIIDTGKAARRGALSAAQRVDASRQQPGAAAAGGRQAMRPDLIGGAIAVILLVAADRRLQLAVHRLSDPAGAGGAARSSGARGHRAGPERQSAVHRQRHLYRQAHPRPGIAVAGSDRVDQDNSSGRPDQRLVVDAFARYRINDPLQFYQTLGRGRRRSQLAILLNSALRRVLGEATLHPRWCATSAPS